MTNNKAIVICLHSSASSGKQWHALAKDLAGECVVHCPDLLGYGPEPVELSPWNYRMSDEVALLLPLLRQQPRPVHLIGHSMGGSVALLLALQCPQQVASLCLYEPVSMNFLMASNKHSAQMQELFAVYTQLSLLMAEQQTTAAARYYIDFWSGAGSWGQIPPAIQQQIMLRIGNAQREFEALISDTSSAVDFRKLTMPVFYGVGDRGPTMPHSVANIILPQMANASLVQLENAGHMAPATEPQRINPLFIDFIRQHSCSLGQQAA